MYTSYEDRLSFLQQFHQGAEAFQAKIPEAVIKKGDGWKLASIGSSFGMFNTALIYSGRKDLVTELMDAIKELNIPVDIRLVTLIVYPVYMIFMLDNSKIKNGPKPILYLQHCC